MMVRRGLNSLVVLNRQRGVKFEFGLVQRFAAEAYVRCAGLFPREGVGGGYVQLDEVVVTIVSDRRIERIHRDFMAIEGATDVITFEHGDVVMSADTALREALGRGYRVEVELGLYVVHGFLHLNGFDDRSQAPREEMQRVQEVVWSEVRAGLGV
jgi:probable rRNA maturation factor